MKIQAITRGRQSRNDFGRHLEAILILQRAFRATLVYMQNEVEMFAATEIQRIWRGYRTNVDFMIVVVSSIRIQKFSRKLLAELKMKQAIAATTLQRAARVMLKRVNSEATEIQRIWRGCTVWRVHRSKIKFCFETSS